MNLERWCETQDFKYSYWPLDKVEQVKDIKACPRISLLVKGHYLHLHTAPTTKAIQRVIKKDLSNLSSREIQIEEELYLTKFILQAEKRIIPEIITKVINLNVQPLKSRYRSGLLHLWNFSQLLFSDNEREILLLKKLSKYGNISTMSEAIFLCLYYNLSLELQEELDNLLCLLETKGVECRST